MPLFSDEETFSQVLQQTCSQISLARTGSQTIPKPVSGKRMSSYDYLRPFEVLKVWSTDPQGLPRHFKWVCKRSELFSQYHQHVICLFTVVTFALMVYRQWWIKLLGSWSESRQWHQTILEVMPSLPTMHLKKKKKKTVSLQHILDEAMKTVFMEPHFYFGIFSKTK